MTVEQTVEDAARLGIRYLTVYGFSTENWKRSAEEVGGADAALPFYLKRLLKIAKKNNVRVKMIGDRTRFDSDIIEGHQPPGRRNGGKHGHDLCDRSQLRRQR